MAELFRRAPRGAGVYLAILTLGAGCTVGPDYHIPVDAMVNSKAARAKFLNSDNAAFVQPDLPDHWWRLYADPRLDLLVLEAFRANTDLRAANANLARAAASIREAQSSRTINTEISGGITDTRQGGIDTLSFPSWSYSLGGGISYPLDLAGGLRRAVQAATADAESVRAMRDQVRVTVAAAIARNYVAACSANRTLATAENVVRVQAETLSEVGRLFVGGRATQFDVTRARTAVKQSEAAIPTIIAQRQAALYALAALMGRPAARYPRSVEESCPTPPPLLAPLPIGNGTTLIKRRSDVRAAERNLAAATAAIGVQTAQLFPQVSIGGAIGFAGPFSMFGSASSFGGNIGPLVSWTFPNVSAARARIDEAGAASKAAAAQFDGAVLTALQQVETALDADIREIDHDQVLQQARDSAGKAAQEATKLFRFGRVSILDVLTTEAALATSESTLAASEAALADDQVTVFLALGGGWEP